MRKCPKCGNSAFSVKAGSHDTVHVLCTIKGDGDIVYEVSGDEEVGDTTYAGNAKCCECECNIEIATGKVLKDRVELLPYSVLMLYHPDIWPNDEPETYYEWTLATDPVDAAEKVQTMAIAANKLVNSIGPEGIKAIAIFRGHIEMEEGASQ